MHSDLIAAARSTVDLALQQGVMIATAESCTGGLIAASLTEFAGSSAVFDRGFVTYSNEAKHDMLGVPARLIEGEGAVSAAVATAMAEGALRHARADVAVSVTGIAGPSGGSAQKPVGLVFIAVASKDGQVDVKEHQFADADRDTVRRRSAIAALAMIDGMLRRPKLA